MLYDVRVHFTCNKQPQVVHITSGITCDEANVIAKQKKDAWYESRLFIAVADYACVQAVC